MRTTLIYSAAAFAEIGGCFAFWAWLRLGYSVFWLIPGVLALASFAFLLTLAPVAFAGRAFAAYGGIYIMASLVWMAGIERNTPDRWDILGAFLCIAGAGVILFGSRT